MVSAVSMMQLAILTAAVSGVPEALGMSCATVKCDDIVANTSAATWSSGFTSLIRIVPKTFSSGIVCTYMIIITKSGHFGEQKNKFVTSMGVVAKVGAGVRRAAIRIAMRSPLSAPNISRRVVTIGQYLRKAGHHNEKKREHPNAEHASFYALVFGSELEVLSVLGSEFCNFFVLRSKSVRITRLSRGAVSQTV